MFRAACIPFWSHSYTLFLLMKFQYMGKKSFYLINIFFSCFKCFLPRFDVLLFLKKHLFFLTERVFKLYVFLKNLHRQKYIIIIGSDGTFIGIAVVSARKSWCEKIKIIHKAYDFFVCFDNNFSFHQSQFIVTCKITILNSSLQWFFTN